jgi:type IV secretion system protein VirD4
MQPEEAGQLDFFSYHPHSVILGQNSSGQLACFNRQGHILVMAPPRSGKGIGFVQANCIGYQGSLIVTDPKGENAAVTYRFRREILKQNVVILDPTGKLESYQLNPAIPTHRFNPLAVFQNSRYHEVVDDIERIADALLVPKDGEREQHWRDGARSIFKGLLTYMVFFMPPEQHNLVVFSRLANGLEVSLDDVFLALVHNPHPDSVMRDVIARAGSFWDKVNVKERASFVSVALRSLSWLNSPVWHKHLTGSDFHPYDLKAGKTTVYIVCPFDKLEDYSPWFRLVLSSCIVAILRAPNRSAIPTLFMLDEYAATIGRLAALEHSIPYMEGVGGRYAMVFQYLSQMTTLWPNGQHHGIFASAGAHVFFNVGDQLTSEYVSSYMGKYGAMTPSGGSMSFVQRDLLMPDEVRRHPENDLIAFVRGYRPSWLGKLDVRRHGAFSGRFDPNPAYFVLPAPKPALTGSAASSGAMLSAAEAIARAKSAPKITAPAVAAAIAAKYPNKKLRFDGDLYGYDEPWLNPATGRTENVFVPVMHASLLEALGS